MQKGVMRVEPNISIRPVGATTLGNRTEIKNLNSFRALERSALYEIERQSGVLQRGEKVVQETRGWDEGRGATYPQRSKEEADDYRYFPEPDLPPLLVDPDWLEQVRLSLPELPAARFERFQRQYGLSAYDAGVLTADPAAAEYFERVARVAPKAGPKAAANWITGDLYGLLNAAGQEIDAAPVPSEALAELIGMVAAGEINQNTAKTVLSEMFAGGGVKTAGQIVAERGLRQVSDSEQIAGWVAQILDANPAELTSYYAGKETVAKWLFGQVMRLARGQANPQVIQQELDRQLAERRS
jgi:aspartyl-tRNA(Asn)/glutamyl-tRNA(Gln) amidotransferase subunit B